VRADGGARRAWKWNAQQGRQAEWQLVLHLPPRQAPLGECIRRAWPLYGPLSALRTYELRVPEGLAESENEMLSQLDSTSGGYSSHTIMS